MGSMAESLKDRWRSRGGSGDSCIAGRRSDTNKSPQPLTALKNPAIFGPPPKHRTAQLGGNFSPSDEKDNNNYCPNSSPSGVSRNAKQWTHPIETPLASNDQVDRSDIEAALPDKNAPHVQSEAMSYSKRSLPPKLPCRNPPDRPNMFFGNTSTPSTGASSHINQEAKDGSPLYGTSRAVSADKAQQGLSHIKSQHQIIDRTSASPANLQASQHAQAHSNSTTISEKQDAFETARALHKDPASVSFSSVQTAAATADKFRARHGADIIHGAEKANAWNPKNSGVRVQLDGSSSAGQYDQQQGGAAPSVAPRRSTLISPPPLPRRTQEGTLAAQEAQPLQTTPLPPPLPLRQSTNPQSQSIPSKPSNPHTSSTSISNRSNIRTFNPTKPPPIPLSTKPGKGTKMVYGWIPPAEKHESSGGGSGSGDGGGGFFGG